MKSKPPKGRERKGDIPAREPQPSAIEVRDSWIELSDRRSPHPSMLENAPTLRPPAITLPDDALIIEKEDSEFPDYEGPTLPRARAFRPLLGSLDEEALVRELAGPPTEQSPGEAEHKDRRKTTRPPRRSTTSPPARRVEDLDLSSIPAFEDLTPEMQYLLLAEATERRVGATTTLVETDTRLVVKGAVRVGLSRGEGMGGMWNAGVPRRGRGDSPALCTVGFGEIELVDGQRVAGRCTAGEVVFPSCVLASLPAPQLARAGNQGATVILAETEVVQAALGELPLLGRKLRAAI